MHHQVAKIKLNENLSLMPLVYNFIITLDEKGLHCTLLHYLVYPHPRLPKYLPIRKKIISILILIVAFLLIFFVDLKDPNFVKSMKQSL